MTCCSQLSSLMSSFQVRPPTFGQQQAVKQAQSQPSAKTYGNQQEENITADDIPKKQKLGKMPKNPILAFFWRFHFWDWVLFSVATGVFLLTIVFFGLWMSGEVETRAVSAVFPCLNKQIAPENSSRSAIDLSQWLRVFENICSCPLALRQEYRPVRQFLSVCLWRFPHSQLQPQLGHGQDNFYR